ncbi:hypothetical protein SteCoe_25383 [Stentor coeruleus]|uniref:B box-type domain-containing protein n=1 Tax=Stentor coeruleus TaxID=5963 RepID=A0A1R2BFD3_9CILI|nr:hypothetical protein SteCoe_25383 [Stentor coeruleus]
MTDEAPKCRGCAGEAVMICLYDSFRSCFCKSCLPTHLISATDRTHTLLPMQASPFIKTRRDEKKFIEKMSTIDDFIIKVQQRIERLQFIKEKSLLEIQLAGEELKRLVDKELEKKSEELENLSKKHETKLTNIKQSLSNIRYSKGYEGDNLLEKILTDRSVAEQLSLEPLDFHLIADPILTLLPQMVSFFLREIEVVNSRIVFPDFASQQLVVFCPIDEKSSSVKVQSLDIRRASGCYVLPDGSVLIAGGRVKGESIKKYEKINPTLVSACEINEMFVSRDCFAIMHNESFVYVFGGWDYAKQQALKECKKLDLRTMQWFEVVDVKEPKFNTTVVFVNELFYVAGKGSRVIEKYDPTYDSFVAMDICLPNDSPCRLLPTIDKSILILQ